MKIRQGTSWCFRSSGDLIFLIRRSVELDDLRTGTVYFALVRSALSTTDSVRLTDE